ncbi:PLP-dependent cysteine synthase family protein [Anoxynatronum buryatiense]|uniref:cysteine synthase n=1 Tax=Anoxynatronum buryatiense TaxID=489973 RepID=A0AA45WWY3_9CLOT|nr:cysteine synthase family protein [Anoxynatronum buryatiense]SMP56243.1 cysteine synthase A [Anoxynatronum buryatiense]
MQGAQASKQIDQLSEMIGKTPLLKIFYRLRGEVYSLYAKAEHYNLTGSIKDRMALHIIRKAYEEGTLNPGDMIIEATSGNTGISFSAIGRALGHPVMIFMPDWMSHERMNLIRSFGAEISLVSSEEGGFLGSIQMAADKALELRSAFLPRQFSNENNCNAHFLSTGPEIAQQTQWLNARLQAFVAGVGTGGTVMGIGKFLKGHDPKVQVHPLEPLNSPTLSTGHKVGKHRIQGISDEFIPDIVRLDQLDEIISVDDGDAIIMAQKMAKDLGLGVGISSGANVLGAISVQQQYQSKQCVVTVLSDDNKKYLSTDLMKPEPAKEGFLAPEVELLDYQVCR